MDTIAKEIMSHDLITANDSTTIKEAIHLLIDNGITGVPVVDSNGHMIGVLSEFDIIAVLDKNREKGPDIFQETIPFSKDIVSIQEEATLHDIMERFLKNEVRRLPVLNEKKQLVGIITRRDIMRLFYYRVRLG